MKNPQRFTAQKAARKHAQSRMRRAQFRTHRVRIGAGFERENQTRGQFVSEPIGKLPLLNQQRATLIAIVCKNAGDRHAAKTARRRHCHHVVAMHLKSLRKRFAGQRQTAVAVGLENLFVARGLHPRRPRVISKKGQLVADEQCADAAEMDVHDLNDVRLHHRRMRHDFLPSCRRNAAGGRCVLRAIARNEQVGLEGPRDPAAHRGVKTADENGHACRHANRAHETGDEQPMATAGHAQMAARQSQRNGIDMQGGQSLAECRKQSAGQNACAQNPEQPSRIGGNGQSAATREPQRREPRQKNSEQKEC